MGIGRSCSVSDEDELPKPIWWQPFRQVFIKVDENRDGEISVEEFNNALTNDERIRSFLMVNLSDSQYENDTAEAILDRLFKEVDTNRSGTITWDEFLEYFGRVRPLEVAENPKISNDVLEMLHDVFEQVDTTKDGSISKVELCVALRNDEKVRKIMNMPIPYADNMSTFNYLFTEIDVDKSSNISWNEFLAHIARRQDFSKPL